MLDTYFRLGDVELFNGERLRGYLRTKECPSIIVKGNPCPTLHEALGHPAYTYEVQLDGNDEPIPGTGIYAAPWYDPALPASIKFYGFEVTSINGIGGARRSVSEVAGLTEGRIFTSRRRDGEEVTFTVALFAEDREGAEYGLAWLTSVLDGSICEGGCGMRDLGFFADCPTAQTAGRLSRRLIDVVATSGPFERERVETSDGLIMLTVELTLGSERPGIYGPTSTVLDENLPSLASTLAEGQTNLVTVPRARVHEAPVTKLRNEFTNPIVGVNASGFSFDENIIGSADFSSNPTRRPVSAANKALEPFSNAEYEYGGVGRIDMGSVPGVFTHVGTLRATQTNVPAGEYYFEVSVSADAENLRSQGLRVTDVQVLVSISVNGLTFNMSPKRMTAGSLAFSGGVPLWQVPRNAAYDSGSSAVFAEQFGGAPHSVPANATIEVIARIFLNQQFSQPAYRVVGISKIGIISGDMIEQYRRNFLGETPRFPVPVGSLPPSRDLSYTWEGAEHNSRSLMQTAPPTRWSALLMPVDNSLGTDRENGAGAIFIFSAIQSDVISNPQIVRIGRTTANDIPVDAGLEYVFQVSSKLLELRFSLQGIYTRLVVDFFNSSGGLLSSAFSPYTLFTSADGTYNTATVTATAPAGAVRATLSIGIDPVATWAADPWALLHARLLIDEAMVVQGNSAVAFFDGDTFDTATHQFDWTGTPNLSTSTRIAIASTPPDPLADPDCPPVPAPPKPPQIADSCIADLPLSWQRRWLGIGAEEVTDALVTVPELTIQTLATAAENVRITWWRIPPGADPSTAPSVGEDISQQVISYLPPQTRIRLDSLTGRATAVILSDGVEREADHLLYGIDGAPIIWPRLSCADAYAISIDTPTSVPVLPLRATVRKVVRY